MVEMTTTVDPKSLAELSAAIERLQTETRRDTREAIAYAGGKVAESGRAASKKGKRLRPFRDNPDFKAQAKTLRWARKQQRQGKPIPAYVQTMLADINNTTPFYIESYRQGKEGVHRIPRFERNPSDPARTIKNRGLAAQIWGIMAAKSYDSTKRPGTSYRRGRHWSVVKTEDKQDIALRMVNKLGYLERAYPGITTTAVTNGTRALVGMLERKIARTVRKANAA